MESIPTLIQDLALILAVAGVVTIVFKKLKQPLVLGYIVAGFIAGPHFVYTPSVHDVNNIDVWAQIGIIVLLFTLGLEFSFKKIIKMGGAPVIAALTIIFCMMFLGSSVGHLFGWKRMDSIYLGGMLAMSSTTIIYKAFQDSGVLKQRFAGLVLSVLILEDILAIVLMVVLSTLAVSHSIEGGELLYALLRLAFFLVLWFVVGMYFLPLILRRFKRLLNNETLLILSLALCFGMAVVAVYSGFSAAFGAFVVGSILAETVEAEHIEHLVSPIKDLFGAIFFVSVGMLVDPDVLLEYTVPVLVIVLTIILGQAIFGSAGFILAGQPLKEAMKCGFSMSQIGEFAFIIASLGTSLGVTSSFLYPIVVAVSVITTFTTPYMLKLSGPAYTAVCKVMPKPWIAALDRVASGGFTVGHPGMWKALITAMIRQIVIFSILCTSIITISFQFFLPFMRGVLPHWWANAVCGVMTLLALSPFLRGIMARGRRSSLFIQLWKESRSNRLPLIFTLIVRGVVVCAFVFYIVRFLVPFADALLLVVAMFIVVAILLSRRLKRNSIQMEKVFMDNLRSRELYDRQTGKIKPGYADRLLSRDLHLADFEVSAESIWGGRLLKDLNLGHRFNVNIASIIRGERRINIPRGDDRLYPGDHLQVIGTDQQIGLFGQALDQTRILETDEPGHDDVEREMLLKQLVIEDGSEFVGEKLKDSGLRNRYHCMIVGYETPDGILEKPDAERVFQVGDIVWVVGERKALHELMTLSPVSKS